MRNPFKAQAETPEPEAPLVRRPASIDLAKAVYESPVDFNRATRRSVGLWGRIWKWNPPENIGAGGRYVRRHYTEAVMTAPKTRRQRRHRARILRAIGAK